MKTQRCFSAVLAVLCVGSACQEKNDQTFDSAVEAPPGWVSPDEQGPYGVGVTTVTWTDARGKDLVADVWYPATHDVDAEVAVYTPTILTGDAVRDAEADLRGAPYPTLAFSHGNGGIRFQSVFLVEHLASHGRVVIAPDHRHNTLLDINFDHILDVLVERPGDVQSSVDELEQLVAGDGLLAGLADTSQYAVMGHSFGAFTSLVVGGGVWDLDGITQYCAKQDGGLGCDMFDGVSHDIAKGHVSSDERATVTIPLAPGVWYAFGLTGGGLSSVRSPFVLGGDWDQVLDYQEEILPCYQLTSAPHRMMSFANAGHYGFSNLCDLSPLLSEECDGQADGWMDMSVIQHVSKTAIQAYLNVVADGDDRSADWMGDEWLAEYAGVTLMSED